MSFRKILSGLFFQKSRYLGRFYRNTPSQLASLSPPVNSRFLGCFYKNYSSLASLGPSIYKRTETGVFLDIENCDISEDEAHVLRENIEKTLQNEGYNGVVNICVVGNMELDQNRRVIYTLVRQGISIFHIHPNQKKPKEASDKLLIVKMFSWALDLKTPGNLMLISGDGDYADSLLELQKRDFNIMVMVPLNKCSIKLVQIAKDKLWIWKTWNRVNQRSYSQKVWLDLKKFITSEDYSIWRSLDQSKAGKLIGEKCLNYLSLGNIGLVCHMSFSCKVKESSCIELPLAAMTKQLPNWSPNNNHGGTCVAIAGSDYCVMATDYRKSTGYSTLGGNDWELHELERKAVLSSSGFPTDVQALKNDLKSKNLIYQHQHNKKMSCPAMAELLSNTFYLKRFFPYYAFNVLGGLDEEGIGCVFTYDALGSCERVAYVSQGPASTLIMSFLDNQLKSPSPLVRPAQDSLSEAEAVDLVKSIFASATERDISTGNWLEIKILKADGIMTEFIELRKH